ncbi:queuosine salvage family protein [Solirubrobacter phytolaccae]|uniref:Queuosine 5'-phosphate N-glycosylase/hydrolase n=1 Tax=Solirubrobacter phytolaccae TaxID=1404360 RepID=A0A9X3NI64_9ACTN|nr:queuosine salvage family protein [Solirubrobacter phytolaccae]MDA0185557.1 queuosine salvage family protein [Solirubrobacter phytolaccae]
MLADEVRRHCAQIAASAKHVTIDLDAPIALDGVAGLDDTLHFLEGSEEDVARYVFILDAINFGSGFFHELATTTDAITERLTAHAREHGPWTADALQHLDARQVGNTLGLEPSHRLTHLYAEALNQLGAWLPDNPIGATADDLARRLTQMPFFADHGFYKRAQITANDLQLAGVADFPDIDRLTIFADNLVPQVLRLDGVLIYDDALAHAVDEQLELPAGGEFERELRATAVHACEQLAAKAQVPPRTLDNWLWNRGQHPPYSERPAHITKTVFY